MFPSSLPQYPQKKYEHAGAYYPNESTKGLDATVESASKRALQYECQIREVECFKSKLAEHLSNYRAVDGLLHEALSGLHRHSRRADKALDSHVPHMHRELDESLEALSDLVERLPKIRSQVAEIKRVYDSGRVKAQQLVADLEWLNTDFYERWWKIIFTSNAPVSWRWRALLRFLFAVFFLTFAWVAWIALRGAYRAHRQRLVWGERVMS